MHSTLFVLITLSNYGIYSHSEEMVSIGLSEDKQDSGFHIVNDDQDQVSNPAESFVTPNCSQYEKREGKLETEAPQYHTPLNLQCYRSWIN